MIRRPPRSTRTDTLFPYTTLFRSRAEKLVWTSLLQSELDHYLRRAAEDPDYRWRDTADVALYGEPGTAVPARLARLSLGIHDEIRVDGGQGVAPGGDYGRRRPGSRESVRVGKGGAGRVEHGG